MLAGSCDEAADSILTAFSMSFVVDEDNMVLLTGATAHANSDPDCNSQ